MLTKGIQMWAPTTSPHFIHLRPVLITGDDVTGKMQLVHLEIKDGMVTAA